MSYDVTNPDHFHSTKLGAIEGGLESCDCFMTIEEDECVSVVTQLSSPYLLYVDLMHLALDQICLLSERVLVDSDDFFVGKNGQCSIRNIFESTSY